MQKYFYQRQFEPRDFNSGVESAVLLYNYLLFQFSKNINITPGQYGANQVINGKEGYFYVRLFAFDGATQLREVFPTFNNYAVGDIITSFLAMYTQGGNLTGALSPVYIVKAGDAQTYVCTEIMKGAGSGTSVNITIDSSISIKTGCLGAVLAPIIRFVR